MGIVRFNFLAARLRGFWGPYGSYAKAPMQQPSPKVHVATWYILGPLSRYMGVSQN